MNLAERFAKHRRPDMERAERVFRKSFRHGVFDGKRVRAYCWRCNLEIDVTDTKSLYCPECHREIKPKLKPNGHSKK